MKRILKIVAVVAVLAVVAVTAGCAALHDAAYLHCRDFEADGVGQVVLRAEWAAHAKVTAGTEPGRIRVCGVANGGAAGYHSPDPGWTETPADEWGLDFKAQRFVDVLVVSTFNEMAYIHHHYYFDKLRIERPEDIPVRLQNRELTGDGAADLGAP